MGKRLDVLAKLIETAPKVGRRDFIGIMTALGLGAAGIAQAKESEQIISDLDIYAMRMLVYDSKTPNAQSRAVDELTDMFTYSYGFDPDNFEPFYADDVRVFYHDLLDRQQQGELIHAPGVKALEKITAWAYGEPPRIGEGDVQPIYVTPRFFDMNPSDALSTLFFALNYANDMNEGFSVDGNPLDIECVSDNVRFQMLVTRSNYEALRFIEGHELKVTPESLDYYKIGFLSGYNGIQGDNPKEEENDAITSQIEAFDQDFVIKMKRTLQRRLRPGAIMKSQSVEGAEIIDLLYRYDAETGPLIKIPVRYEI